MASPMIEFRLKPELLEQAELVARREGDQSVSLFVRRLLLKELRAEGEGNGAGA